MIYKIISFINKIIPKRNKIFLFTGLGYYDNIKALGDYLINNNYTDKYKIVITQLEDEDLTCLSPKVKFVNNNKLTRVINYITSKYIFSAFGPICIKPSKNQKVIEMWHGTPLKIIGRIGKEKNQEFYFTHVLATSDYFKPIMSEAFSCPLENVTINGQPRNDTLFKNNDKPEFISDSKFIFWAPTYRKSSFLQSINGDLNNIIPIFDKQDYEILNAKLKELNIKLLVKLHPMQDVEEEDKTEMSNLYIYGHKDFIKKGYEIYSLASYANALISDYSSIFLDYLLLDRPVAFTLEDMNQYKNNRGFVMDNPMDFMPGDKIFTKNEFYKFINDIANNEDKYKGERARVNNLCNYYKDGNNCQRVLDIAGIIK